MEDHVSLQQGLGLAILSLPKSRDNDGVYGASCTEPLSQLGRKNLDQ